MKKRLLCVLIALTMLCGMVPFSAFADVVIVTRNINYVQVDGLDMPVVGELPDREVELIEGSGYTVDAPETFANSFIGGVAWYDVTTDEYMAEGEVFVANPVDAIIAYQQDFIRSPSRSEFWRKEREK